jgi:NhaA family Na+:H+ antiporter
VIRPLERFIHVQAASGIVLLLCATIALCWANSRWGATYEALWETHIQAAIGPWTVRMSLHTFVNDVLMAVFFFVIGLEIRREIHDGELRTLRSAALPVFAALGGMAVPAAIYVLVAPADARQGWAVPVSTDTAFALSILALLGARVAPSLRVLLLAVAVIDDILAIIIIAVFYSSGLHWGGIVVAFIGLGAILGLQRLGVRRAVAYAAPALAVWGGCWHAGIHPTVAGIIMGLLTPARIWYGHQAFVDVAYGHLATISRGLLPNRKMMDVERPMSELRRAQREAVSPVERIETAMHAWAAFAIMPIFALANAGIDFARVELDAAPRLVAGIVVGLVVGKLAGIVSAVRLGVALGIAQLPSQVTWRGIVVLAAVAGVGFTMALFIANLAFGGSEPLQDIATIAVFVASAMSGLLALLLGLILLRKAPATVFVPIGRSSDPATVHLRLGRDAENTQQTMCGYEPR